MVITLVLVPDHYLALCVPPDYAPVDAGTHAVSVGVKTLGTNIIMMVIIIVMSLTSLSVSPGLPYLASMSGW